MVKVVNPPASEEDIREANGAVKGLLPSDFKEMTAVHNGQRQQTDHG